MKNKIRNKFIGLELDPSIQKQIPSKGAESADFLISFVNSKDEIPEQIRNAFDKLRN